MAVVMAFPTTQMFDLIAEGGRDDSYYMDLIVRFAHFIFVQVAALLFALVAIYSSLFVLQALSLLLLIYAILNAALTGIALFEVALFYNQSKR